MLTDEFLPKCRMKDISSDIIFVEIWAIKYSFPYKIVRLDGYHYPDCRNASSVSSLLETWQLRWGRHSQGAP